MLLTLSASVCCLQNTQRISSAQSTQPLATPVVSVTTPSLQPQGLVYSGMPTAYNTGEFKTYTHIYVHTKTQFIRYIYLIVSFIISTDHKGALYILQLQDASLSLHHLLAPLPCSSVSRQPGKPDQGVDSSVV